MFFETFDFRRRTTNDPGDERRRRRSPRPRRLPTLPCVCSAFPSPPAQTKQVHQPTNITFVRVLIRRALAAGNCPLNAQTHIPESQLSFICFKGIIERQPGAITGAQLLLSLPERNAQCSLRALRFCFRALFCCFAEHASPQTAAAAGLTAIKSCQLVITLQWQFHHPH